MIVAAVVIQLLVLALSVVLWIAWFRGKFSTSESYWSARPGIQSPPQGILDFIGAFCVWFGLQIVAVVVGFAILGFDVADLESGNDPEALLKFSAMAMVTQIIAMVVVAFWLGLRYRNVLWMGMGSPLWKDFKCGIVGFVMIIPIVYLIQIVVTQLIPYEHPTLDAMKDISTPIAIFCAWFTAVVAAPLTEEFFFRGMLQGLLHRFMDRNDSLQELILGDRKSVDLLMGSFTHSAADMARPDSFGEGNPSAHPSVIQSAPQESNPYEPPTSVSSEVPAMADGVEPVGWKFWMPIVLTSLLFAAAHAGQGPAPIPLFFFSLGVGYLFRKTGSILPCIVIHFLLNATSMSILTLHIWFPESFPME